MTLETHECEADGCSAPCAREHFMCLPHWRMVPKAMRDEIWASYRIYVARGRAGKRTIEHVKRLRQAHEMAVAAVREKEINRATRRSEHQPGLEF